MAERSAAIDIVRVLGVVAVVAGHLWGAQAVGEVNPVRVALFPWHVALFFFLTGYLWSSGRPLASEVRTRWRSLMVPFLAWTVLLGVPIYTLIAIRSGFPAEDIGLTLWGGGLVRGFFAPYWFLPVLFLVAVLLRALERLPRWVAWSAAGGGLIATYLWGAELSRLPHDFFFALPCLLFALVGQEIRRRRQLITSPVWTGAAMLTVSAAGLATGIVRPLDMKLGDFGDPGVGVVAGAAMCAGLVLLVEGLVDGRRIAGSAFITTLAKGSVVVLLTHTFAFVALYAVGLPSGAVFLLTLVGCWALALVILRSPLSGVLAGVPAAKTRQAPVLAGNGEAQASSGRAGLTHTG